MHHTCHRQHRGSRVLGLWRLSIHQLLCHKSAHLWYTPMVIFVMLQHQHWQFCKTHNVPLITSSFLSLGNIAELIIPVTIYRTDIVKVLVVTVNHAIVPSTVKDISLYFEICIRLCLLFSGRKKKPSEICSDCSQKKKYLWLHFKSEHLCATPAMCTFNSCSGLKRAFYRLELGMRMYTCA